MTPKRRGSPPSRYGKRQLVVFLAPTFAASVRSRALREEKTMQEMLATAMNAVLAKNGYKQVFPIGHQRFMKRKNGTAAPRQAENTSLVRRGRASISGWFEIRCLDQANAAAYELGNTLQEFSEAGLKMIMNLATTPPPATFCSSRQQGESIER